MTKLLMQPNRNFDLNSQLVGCFGFNGLLKQYFSLHRAVY